MQLRRETVEHRFGTIEASMSATHFKMKRSSTSVPRWRYTCGVRGALSSDVTQIYFSSQTLSKRQLL